LERQKQKEASSSERRQKRRPSGAWKLKQVLRNRLDGACNNGRAPAGRCVGQIIAPRLDVSAQIGLIPQRLPAVDPWNATQAVRLGWQPLQCARLPDIARILLVVWAKITGQVIQKYQYAGCNYVRAGGGNHIQKLPAAGGCIGINTPGHAGQTG